MSLAVKRFNIVKNIFKKSMFDDNMIYKILTYYWDIFDLLISFKVDIFNI
jgi:hypothetical protein